MNLDDLTVDGLHRSFEEQGYICEQELAVTVCFSGPETGQAPAGGGSAGFLNQETIKQTLNMVFKNKEDIDTLVREVGVEALAAGTRKT